MTHQLTFKDRFDNIWYDDKFDGDPYMGILGLESDPEPEKVWKFIEKELARVRSDLAHAIGFCRGLGHPETYLEKKYPELLSQSVKENK